MPKPHRNDGNDGADAGFLSSKYGLTPDPWQAAILDSWLRFRSDGRWAAQRCGLALPRQNGKNGVLEMRELFGMIVLGEKFLHTAHEIKTARKAFIRLASFFENPRRYPELAALVQEVRRANGQEAIVLRNGGSCEFIARSKSSGRGYTEDVLVMDEAQELNEEAYEALLSTISAGPLGNSQQILTGTPPGPKANGEIFTRFRNDGLEGKDLTLSWHEWSCPADADLDDDKNVMRANPAVGIRLQWDIIRAERGSLSDEGYGRERLGKWDEVNTHTRVVPVKLWTALSTDKPPAQDKPPNALAVDMSHDRIMAISGCWLTPTSTHVEILALDLAQDTMLTVDWIVERAGRRIPVVIDSYSPAASMIPVLKARKVKVITTNPKGSDMIKACGGIYDDIFSGRLTHADQKALNDALAGAKKRKIGDEGGWGWDRKDPSVNIAPLVAATLARFGAVVTNKPKSDKPSGRRAVVL